MLKDSMLIGFKSFQSKKGADCYMMSVLCEASSADTMRGMIGFRVIDAFLTKEQYDILKPSDIGKCISVTRNLAGSISNIEVLD